jgi:TolB protein
MLLVLLVVMAPNSYAALTLRITQGVEGALPIAVVPFGWIGTGARPEKIASIVADDLRRSGRFAPIAEADLPGQPRDASEIRFSDWRLLGTGNLVIGRLVGQPDGRYTIQFRLFDVFRAKQLAGYQLDASADQLRQRAHQISDIIYEKLTGEPGAFATRIAYVTEFDNQTSAKPYALNIADSDGADAQVVLESSEPLMSPAWSPDGKQLAYVSFEGGRPRVFLQELTTGKREEVAGFPGINGAPTWSPDGLQLAVTLSKDGNPEIYILDLRSRRLRRLTRNVAIDTEPSWAPDGRSLAFTSDRGGTPQVYRIPLYGGRATRLTFDGQYNARATFSPSGRELAFVHGADGAYRIAVLDLETSALRVLTDSRLDESPSFAPNGSMVLYATSDAEGAALAAISVDGRVKHRMAVEGGKVREPAWSPFRKSDVKP